MEAQGQQQNFNDQISLLTKPLEKRQQGNAQQSPNSSFTANSVCKIYLTHEEDNIRNASANNFKNLFTKITQQDHLNYYRKCPYDQIKRLVILKFILSFGFNFQNAEKMFTKLVGLSKGQFKDSPQQFRAFQSYICRFITLGQNYQRPQIDQQYITLFYFSYQTPEIYKRVTKLHKLKKLQKMYQSKPDKFPFNQVFQVILQNKNQAVKFPYWKAQQDFIMLSLILQKGFGRWESILSSTEWEKYKGEDKNGQKRYVSNKKYRQHLQIILFDGKKVIPIGLVDLLEERAAYFLKLVK